MIATLRPSPDRRKTGGCILGRPAYESDVMEIGSSREKDAEPSSRRYDKGERRFKHVGREPYAVIEFVDDNPKMAVGKCPNNLDTNACELILSDAIDGSNGDRDLPFPKKLYAVHVGVIYEAQTTDWGKSYHGYPYHGRLPRKLVARLREIAVAKKCETEFASWVKRHIL